MSLVACSRFLSDQFDFGFLSVRRCKNEASSSGSFCPSIQPKRIASITQSVHVTACLPDLALKMCTQSSLLRWWWLTNHSLSSAASWNAIDFRSILVIPRVSKTDNTPKGNWPRELAKASPPALEPGPYALHCPKC